MGNDSGRRWYLTAIAAVYLAVCTAASLYYLSLHFRSHTAMVPALKALCLAFAVAAATYFIRARAGHIGLTALTGLTLIAIGTTNPRATGFHFSILLLLLVPILRKRNNNHSPIQTNTGELL